jgi:ABC-2 type transport system permease protein
MGKFKLLSFISPLTYFTDLARNSIQGASYFTSFVDLTALLGFAILLFVVSIKWHEKTLSKRF